MAKKKLPAWTTINTHVTLRHGCTRFNALRIQAGVNPTVGKPHTDFGRGFYLTARVDQAAQWARRQFLAAYPGGTKTAGGDRPAIVSFRVPLDALSRLPSLAFVRGEPTNDTFWSFVTHCRGGNSHAHPILLPPNDWYDVVSGPVAALPLANRTAIAGYDQFSFHTATAAAMLNAIPRVAPDFAIRLLKP